MISRISASALIACAVTIVATESACGQRVLSPAMVLPSAASRLPFLPVTGGAVTANVRRSCADDARPGFARCFSLVRTDASAQSAGIGQVPGFGPADLQAAYQLPSSTAGGGQTVAIVDAYDDETAGSDLAAYRANFGLPPCTKANGCYRKVNESGSAGPYPQPNSGWAEEISLDVDMVSAVCPNCRILLVEAATNSFHDLSTAENTAVRLGATEISNSYGGPEFVGESTYGLSYRHPGVAVVASSGDSGYGAQFPAASPYVTAAGGTTLNRASTARGWSETAWPGGGSGCSALEAKPAWQHDTACTRRTIADVAAVADPNTGVAVYDRGWLVIGGTSVASPIIAAVYALAGTPPISGAAQLAYLHRAALFDVVSGANGSCRIAYLCTALPGYDGPTGLGTPRGTNAF